jgi:large subunit ribosomal protein L25
MEPVKISASPRPESGKGPARRLRAAGQIPAVAYGRELPSTPISVSPKALVDVLTSERGRNSVIDLEIEGQKSVRALLCDYTYHPVTRALLHADFLEIRDTDPVDVEVPFQTVGKPKGVVLGGTLRQVFRALPLRCLPKDIPVSVVHDVSELGLEDVVSVADLKLPAGVTVRYRPEQTVLAIVSEKRRGEGEGEGEAGTDAKAGAKTGA